VAAAGTLGETLLKSTIIISCDDYTQTIRISNFEILIEDASLPAKINK
jgi:hypothetical protein